MFASFSMFFLNHLLYSKYFPVLCISSQSILMHLVRHPFYFVRDSLRELQDLPTNPRMDRFLHCYTVVSLGTPSAVCPFIVHVRTPAPFIIRLLPPLLCSLMLEGHIHSFLQGRCQDIDDFTACVSDVWKCLHSNLKVLLPPTSIEIFYTSFLSPLMFPWHRMNFVYLFVFWLFMLPFKMEFSIWYNTA